MLRGESATAPNAIGAFLLYLRDRTGKVPHAYFIWTERDQRVEWLRYRCLATATSRT